MLPTINGKQIIDCNLEELKVIRYNSIYRENEYIDYKSMFSIDLYGKGDKRQEEAIAEFRSDICSFANASGGYYIIGVNEDKGIAQDICGIEIKNENTEQFEMRLKNYLNPIEPRIPNCRFKFLPLANGKFVVIILIHNDAFAPYLHIENQKDYRVYKRIGNDKRTIAYTELKRMFVQSVALEKEIEKYRKERIAYYKEQGKERFMLVHIIPDTFVDSSYNKLVYALNGKNNKELSRIFEPAHCSNWLRPIVDGLSVRDNGNWFNREGRIFNNFVLECFDSLAHEVETISNYNGSYELLYKDDVWDLISCLIDGYAAVMPKYLNTKRIFVCISMIGCKDVVSRPSEFSLNAGAIEQNELLIEGYSLEDVSDQNCIEQLKRYVRLNYLLSLGINGGEELKRLMEEFA